MRHVSAKGKAELIKHLSGKKITYRQMVLAKCYDCMGRYLDGKVDCKMPDCPLYRHMPYRASSKKSKS